MFRILPTLIALWLVATGLALAAPSAEDFGALPVIDDAALSPNGQEIAVLVNKDGRYFVRVLKLSNLKDNSRVIGLRPDQKPEYLKWVNDKRLVLSFWQSEKFGDTPVRTGYLFTLDTKSMKGKILVRPGKPAVGFTSTTDIQYRQFNNVVVDWLEDDPDHILMSYGSNNNRKPDLRRVNVKTGKDSVIKRGMTSVQSWQTDLTGEPRIGQGRSDGDGDWVLRIKDASTGEWRSSEDFPGLDAGTPIHGFTANPNELIVSSYEGRDTVGLYVYDLQQKKIDRQIYHNDRYDATGVVLSSDGERVIGASYTSETPQTEMLSEYDTVLSRMRKVFDGSNVQFVDMSADGGKVLFMLSSATDPGRLMMVEQGGKPISLGKLRPNIQGEDLGVVIALEYTARDGQTIPGYITVPPAITDMAQFSNIPFVVLPHGGPYARDSKRFDYLAQFLASRGYGILQMNFRGSDGYGKTFKETGRDDWVVMQEDVEDGARWLVSEGFADPKRMCIIGWSYGGYAALMGAAKTPELYSCAVSMAGLTDIKDFIRDQEKYRFGKFSMKSFFGENFKDADDIKSNSPVKLAEQIKIPLLLAHGKRDQVVHFDQFTRMKSALKKSAAPVSYIDFARGDHYLSEQDDRQTFLIELEKFLLSANGKARFVR